MNHWLNASTAIDFASWALQIDWAKRNLDRTVYEKIRKSYQTTMKQMLILALTVTAALTIVALLSASIPKPNTQDDMYIRRTGRVSDDHIFYTYDKARYEILLAEYGYDPADFEYHEEFKVYLDEDGNVVNIIPEKEMPRSVNVLLITVGVSVIVTLVTCTVWALIAKRGCAKIWFQYIKWWQNADLTKDTFTPED